MGENGPYPTDDAVEFEPILGPRNKRTAGIRGETGRQGLRVAARTDPRRHSGSRVAEWSVCGGSDPHVDRWRSRISLGLSALGTNSVRLVWILPHLYSLRRIQKRTACSHF